MSRFALVLATTATIVVTDPAAAQTMQGMDMPGMTMPAKQPAAKAKQPARSKRAPVHRAAPAKRSTPPMDGMKGKDHSAMQMPPSGQQPAQGAEQPVQGMDHSAMPGMSMPAGQQGGHDMHGMSGMNGMAMPGMAQTGTALPAGDAPAPAPPTDHYADRMFAPAEMAKARSDMMFEQGGQPFYQVMFNLAEYQARQGRDGYRWDGEAWFGGDINRLWLKSEGEGAFREGIESAEVQALYSRAIGPYFNLQGGVRQDLGPSPKRTYATVGFEGLAPYMFEVEGALFLSTKGDLLGRLEGYYDQRITQRLVLQPRVEFNLAAQDVPENGIGRGLTDAELGLRLRYEIRRQFAPYVGVSYLAQTGRTADFTRAQRKDPTTTSFVAGVRVWF